MKFLDHRTKPLLKSQQTQTDFSTLTLFEKLKLKDQQILKLQRELQHFKHRNLSLNEDINTMLNQTPSIPGLDNEASVEVKPIKLFTSKEFDPRSKMNKKIPGNLPLDTANIEEFDSYLPKNRPSLDTPDLVPEGTKGFLKFSKKKSSNNSKIPYSKNSKLSVRAKPKLNKNISIISELVYQDGQDMETWSKLINKFREDPTLIKQALDFKEERIRNSVSVEPVQIRTRVGSAFKTRKSSQEVSTDFRPTSAVKSNNYRPVTAKVKEIDWSKSALDGLVASGNSEFDPGETFFSNTQAEEILLNKDFKDFDLVFDKASKTLDKLKTELLVPRNYLMVGGNSEESLVKILQNCSTLFRARALVLKILKLIHEREDVMLRLIASEKEDVKNEFGVMEKLGQEILQIIAFLKHSKFPINNFVYLGEDYAVKINKDNESIISLYPNLKVSGIFDDFSM